MDMMRTRQAPGNEPVDSSKIGPDDPRYRAVVEKRFNKRFSAQPGLRPAGQLDRSGDLGGGGGGEGRTAARRDERRTLPRGIRLGSRGAGDHRRLADEARVLRRGDGRRGGRGRRHGGRDVPGAVRELGRRSYRSASIRGSAWAGTWSAAPSASSAAQLGLAADYLYAVEVVTVDEGGRASSVVATREPSDPNRDLWWAHTGGGGGNFGVVTRYWFRSPDASGEDPASCCPARRSRSRPSRRNGTGATSTSRPSCDCSGTTGSGASATATPIPRTPRSGRCWRFIASSSGRSSSAA